MRLGISSAVAPEAEAEALVESCAHRGLTTLELRREDAHGIIDAAAAEAVRAAAVARGVEIVGLRTDNGDPAMHAVARALGAPVILAGPAPLADRIAEAQALEEGGTAALVEVEGAAEQWLDAVAPAGVAFAWTIDQTTTDPGGDLDAIRQAGLTPLYLRMAGGGGPESAMGEGRGFGSLMARLALDRYAGPLILSPGSPKYRVAWSAWLGRRGGWGCGSAGKSDGPVPITAKPFSTPSPIGGGTA